MKKVEKVYSDLKKKILKYNKNADIELINRAFELASKAHEGQFRKSGDPYIIHPLIVASILADIEMDVDSIVTAILHDVVEDTEYSQDDITKNFGTSISELVAGLTKINSIPFNTKEEHQAENLRKMLLAMAKDIRVIIIKLADRLHNMRTLDCLPPEKQREKSFETMEMFTPIAHRLGMYTIKLELEDLSLKYLDSVAYEEISKKLSAGKKHREGYLQSLKKIISAKLTELNIQHEIQTREKNLFSTYMKMYSQNIPIDRIYDILGIRVIVNSISDCYFVLGLVHELFKPLPGRFKDYIAMPKNNMYQSLHTTMIGIGGIPFEVQIRTWQMHKIAEVGIAAHWKYKESSSQLTDLDKKLEWVRNLIELHKDSNDDGEFIRSLKIDLFEDEVFIFTPKGDLINLPCGSTAVDFAYNIHSEIGNKTVGAKVHGKIVPLDYILKNGDIVEIMTSKVTQGPKRDWLKFVKTNQAKKRIHEWFKKLNRDDYLTDGKLILDRELKRLGLSLSELGNKEWLDAILKRYNLSSLNDLYASVGYGSLSPVKIAMRLKYLNQKSMINNVADATVNNIKNIMSPQLHSSNGILVNGQPNCLVRFSRCCNPVPDDDIIGYVTKGRGVSIHRKDCINAVNLPIENGDDDGRFVDVCWVSKPAKSSYLTNLRIIANKSNSLVINVTKTITDLKVPLIAIDARITKDDLYIININIEIKSKKELEKLIKKLKNIAGVTSVTRYIQ